jgi:diaminopimelate epimerase
MNPIPQSGPADLPFVKMSAAGNDFVVVDAGVLPAGAARSEWVRRVCRRRLSVGADGVIAVERLDAGRLRVEFFNPDGAETFCGNGARCAARYGVLRAGTTAPTMLETVRGPLRAEVAGDRVAVAMGECRVVSEAIHFRLDPVPVRASLVEVGVPHLVTFDHDPGTVDVNTLGRRLRFHPEAGAGGANVNFARRVAPGVLAVRTFERGVEGETLSCGTGCVAAALADALLGDGTSPVTCRTRSGADLKVSYRRVGREFEEVILEGEVRLVYSARLGPET